MSLLEMLELAGEELERDGTRHEVSADATCNPSAITRTRHRLLPDARRVLAKPYLPGEETLLPGPVARASADGADLGDSRSAR